MERSRSRRETIRAIIARQDASQDASRCGFRLGNPDGETWPLLHRYFGTHTEEELRQLLDDDVRWICPQFHADAYQDPQGRQLFDAGPDREKHGSTGPLADCNSAAEIDDFPWPKPEYLNFDAYLRDLRQAGLMCST